MSVCMKPQQRQGVELVVHGFFSMEGFGMGGTIGSGEQESRVVRQSWVTISCRVHGKPSSLKDRKEALGSLMQTCQLVKWAPLQEALS